jgi:hypothetical protein
MFDHMSQTMLLVYYEGEFMLVHRPSQPSRCIVSPRSR